MEIYCSNNHRSHQHYWRLISRRDRLASCKLFGKETTCLLEEIFHSRFRLSSFSFLFLFLSNTLEDFYYFSFVFFSCMVPTEFSTVRMEISSRLLRMKTRLHSKRHQISILFQPRIFCGTSCFMSCLPLQLFYENVIKWH